MAGVIGVDENDVFNGMLELLDSKDQAQSRDAVIFIPRNGWSRDWLAFLEIDETSCLYPKSRIRRNGDYTR